MLGKHIKEQLSTFLVLLANNINNNYEKCV